MSEGGKSERGNFGEILGRGNKVGVREGVYGVYIESKVMGGRGGELEGKGEWKGVSYVGCRGEKDFIGCVGEEGVEMIYLWYGKNGRGRRVRKGELEKWVDYGLEEKGLILYDGGYEG